MKKAKLFICHHPASLLLYKNLIQIIKRYDKDTKIILFKVNHPYFLKFNFEPYGKYFDEIIEFDFIHYKRNLLKSFWEIFNFQKELKKTISNLLAGFEKIDLFLDVSAYLPINVLLYNLSRQKNIKNITRFTLGELNFAKTKTDKIKTFLSALYSLPFKCYKVKAVSSLEGKFINFTYDEETPGDILKIVSPSAEFLNKPDFKGENILPYPVKTKNLPISRKDMVIIFGNTVIHPAYNEYIWPSEKLTEKLANFFKAIEDQYPDCELYYKPHPIDKGKLMPGINTAKYSFFDDSLNAQGIFDKYYERIKAVYSFASTTSILGSFLGLSSYTFYRYLSNPSKIDKTNDIFNSVFNQDNIKSKFLFHLADLSEIGKIDNLKCPAVDSKKLKKIYRKALHV